MRMNIAGKGETWKTPIGEFEVADYKSLHTGMAKYSSGIC